MGFTLSRWWPIMLGSMLVLNLAVAIVRGGRANWLAVAVLAIVLAVNLARRWRRNQ